MNTHQAIIEQVYMIHFASSSFDQKKANILHRIDNYRFINFRRELGKDIKSRVANALLNPAVSSWP